MTGEKHRVKPTDKNQLRVEQSISVTSEKKNNDPVETRAPEREIKQKNGDAALMIV